MKYNLARVSACFAPQIILYKAQLGQIRMKDLTQLLHNPGGIFPNKEIGGLGPHIKFGGKIWGKVRPTSPNKRKNLGSSVTTRRKSWEKVPILGSYLKFRGQNLGYLSLMFLEAKFGAATRISEANFGAKPPRPPNMEVPTWASQHWSPKIGLCITSIF